MPDYEVLEWRKYDDEEYPRYAGMTLKSLHRDDEDPKKRGRFFSGVLNANKVDREGERFDTDGIDIRGFKAAGGPIMVGHFSELTGQGFSGVVARAITTVKAPEGLIIRKAEFDVDPLSEHWMGKVHRGFVRGLSAGLLRRKSELRRSKRDDLQHVVVTESELIHAVLTSQPVNRESLIDAAKSLDRIAVLERDVQKALAGSNDLALKELSSRMADLSDQVASLSENLHPAVIQESDDDLRRLSEATDALYAVACKAARPELPDAAFIIETGAEHDKNGVVRKFRHLPHHTGSVKSPAEHTSINKALLRNALARVNQVRPVKESSESFQARATSHLRRHAKAVGIGRDRKD